MTYLLSIIIPVYNMNKYIMECYTSLKRQCFPDEVEIILIDDGSTDGSSIICDNLVKKDTHCRVFHQDNKGVAAARNLGLQVARGTYIAWVDPDDYITDDWWKTLYPLLKNSPDLIYFDMYTLTNGILKQIHFDKESRIIGRDEWIKELTNGNRIRSHLCSKIIPRKYYSGNKTFDESFSFCEDYQAMHRITWPIKRCVYIHQPLYIYRQHKKSIVHNSKTIISNAALEIKLNKERAEFYNSKGLSVSRIGILNAELFFCLLYYQYNKDGKNNAFEKLYKESKNDLKKKKHIIFNSGEFSLGLKIRTFLLIYNLLSLTKPISIIKSLIKMQRK